MTTSKRRTLHLYQRGHPRVIMDSVRVPRVGNCRLYGRVGRSLRVDRVPIVLLATHGSRRDRLCNCGGKTSTCVAGPFRMDVLCTVIYDRLRGQRQVHAHCASVNPLPPPRRKAFDSTSRRFLGHLGRVVARRLSGRRLNVPFVYGGVKVDETSLCGGLGTLASVKTGSCVAGVHVRETV